VSPDPEAEPLRLRQHSHESPRLKRPRHHRVVRPGAGRRRTAISLAGVMLLIAAALGFVTAAGVLASYGTNQPEQLPGAPVEVSGTVTDVNGTALVNASVHVVSGTNSSLTNADGWYFLGQMRPGVYTLEASKQGYQTERRTIELKPGFPRIVDFALPSGSGTSEGASDRVHIYGNPNAGVIALGLTVFFCSSLAVVGGISALRHRHYVLAVVGAAAGVLTLGFFVGTILSAVALAILGSLKTGFLEAQSHRIPWERSAEKEEPDEEPTESPAEGIIK